MSSAGCCSSECSGTEATMPLTSEATFNDSSAKLPRPAFWANFITETKHRRPTSNLDHQSSLTQHGDCEKVASTKCPYSQEKWFCCHSNFVEKTDIFALTRRQIPNPVGGSRLRAPRNDRARTSRALAEFVRSPSTSVAAGASVQVEECRRTESWRAGGTSCSTWRVS